MSNKTFKVRNFVCGWEGFRKNNILLNLSFKTLVNLIVN